MNIYLLSRRGRPLRLVMYWVASYTSRICVFVWYVKNELTLLSYLIFLRFGRDASLKASWVNAPPNDHTQTHNKCKTLALKYCVWMINMIKKNKKCLPEHRHCCSFSSHSAAVDDADSAVDDEATTLFDRWLALSRSSFSLDGGDFCFRRSPFGGSSIWVVNQYRVIRMPAPRCGQSILVAALGANPVGGYF